MWSWESDISLASSVLPNICAEHDLLERRNHLEGILADIWFHPSVLVDAGRLTEAYGLQTKMTLANDFLLDGSLMIKTEGRVWERKAPDSLLRPERSSSCRPCQPGCVLLPSRCFHAPEAVYGPEGLLAAALSSWTSTETWRIWVAWGWEWSWLKK